MPTVTEIIYCCGCQTEITATLTDGKEIYPHREDLYDLPFWICTVCKNYVGCHYKTKDSTKPLGCIPTPEIRTERRKLHDFMDPLWRSGKIPRSKFYAEMSKKLGYHFHASEVRSVTQIKFAFIAVQEIKDSL